MKRTAEPKYFHKVRKERKGKKKRKRALPNKEGQSGRLNPEKGEKNANLTGKAEEQEWERAMASSYLRGFDLSPEKWGGERKRKAV